MSAHAATPWRDAAVAAQLACLLEASAPKPGNVSPGRHFADARYEDFLASAAAIGPALADAGTATLGATIRRAVEATGRWTRSNTNLGLVLLLAPLARAAARAAGEGAAHPIDAALLRTALARVLDEATVDDAREVYAAIRHAAPGGLGQAAAQDVAHEPTVTLREAMRLAADRDGIAREYDTAFETTFTLGAPTLAAARHAGLAWDDAVVETYLTVLAAAPDTHVARRAGAEAAARVRAGARSVLDAGGVRTAEGRAAAAQLDAALRGPGNAANPGTTADLTAAAILVVLLGGGWHTTPGAGDAGTR